VMTISAVTHATKLDQLNTCVPIDRLRMPD
jgi:hypothetical protein